MQHNIELCPIAPSGKGPQSRKLACIFKFFASESTVYLRIISFVLGESQRSFPPIDTSMFQHRPADFSRIGIPEFAQLFALILPAFLPVHRQPFAWSTKQGTGTRAGKSQFVTRQSKVDPFPFRCLTEKLLKLELEAQLFDLFHFLSEQRRNFSIQARWRARGDALKRSQLGLTARFQCA